MKPLTSNRIVSLRKGMGLNQAVFWGRIGVTQSGGSRYETGRRMPKTVRMLIEIAYCDDGLEIAAALRFNNAEFDD